MTRKPSKHTKNKHERQSKVKSKGEIAVICYLACVSLLSTVYILAFSSTKEAFLVFSEKYCRRISSFCHSASLVICR